MGLRLVFAQGISAVSTWGLKTIFRRPAANFPGKVALYVDPNLVGNLSRKLSCGSVIVCGTNGKTTVTNLLADVLEASGLSVVCNRTGANLDSGIATSLLHSGKANWGVFESDELWLAKVLPQLKSDYLLLLNLFRDQLDRVGEIDTIQESIIAALKSSPDTILVYNADDPQCAAIAAKAPNRSITFGTQESLGLTQNTVVDAHMCQMCTGMLDYSFRQYGQLGNYQCSTCGFKRDELDFSAQAVRIDDGGLSFDVSTGKIGKAHVEAPYTGAYMVYNLLATFVASCLLGVTQEVFQKALDEFSPQNGRLEAFDVGGRPTLLNLAKNPIGFNQNLNIIIQDKHPKAVAFFVNDKEGDGRDVSWIWDIDFEELAKQEEVFVFAGGIRKNDLQVRLKYAGIIAELTDGVAEIIKQLESTRFEGGLYLIANYTALPIVRGELEAIIKTGKGE